MRRTLVVLGLIVALALAYALGRSHEDRSAVEALAGAQRAALQAAGFVRAERARAGELEATVSGLQDQLEIVKRVHAKALLAAHRETREVEFAPPACPEPVGLSVASDLVIAGDRGGGIHLGERLWGTLRQGEWTETRELEVDSERSRVTVAPELERAWSWYLDRPSRLALAPRPIRHWRVGWSCGLGGVQGPAGRAAAGAGCLYGPQM